MTHALTGKQIVNTRATRQAEVLSNLLRLRGAVPLAYPCIDIVTPEDTTSLDTALFNLTTGHYDWLTLTSANTIFAIADRLSTLDLPLMSTAFRTAALGPATAAAAKQILNLEALVIPAEYDAENLANSLPITSESHILLPESGIARPTLVEMLMARGAQVTVVTAYQTVCGYGGDDVPRLLEHQQIDALTFTSSSTVTCFLGRLENESGHREKALTLCAACIGSKTAATARDRGFSIVTTASEHTLESLIDALDIHFAHQV